MIVKHFYALLILEEIKTIYLSLFENKTARHLIRIVFFCIKIKELKGNYL